MEAQERAEEKRNRWEELAKQRNSRTVLCRAPDTFPIVELSRVADRFSRMVRDRAFTSLDPQVSAKVMGKYHELILHLHNLMFEFAELLKIEYKPPRSVRRWLRSKGLEEEVINGEGEVEKKREE